MNNARTAVEFHAMSIPTEDAYYLHFSDQTQDPEFFFVIQGQSCQNFTAIKCPEFGESRSECAITKCELRAGQVRFLLGDSHFLEFGERRLVSISFDSGDHDLNRIEEQLREILGAEIFLATR